MTKIIIACLLAGQLYAYDYVYKCENGVALVKENGIYGLVNEREEVIVSATKADVYAVDPNYIRATSAGKLGITDKTGKEIVPAKYDFIGNFENRVARVKLVDRYGLVTNKGSFIMQPKYDNERLEPGIETKYDNVHAFIDGFAKTELNDKWGMINEKNEELLKPEYDHIGDHLEGIVPVVLDGKEIEVDLNKVEIEGVK